MPVQPLERTMNAAQANAWTLALANNPRLECRAAQNGEFRLLRNMTFPTTNGLKPGTFVIIG
jgi:hypothetical protein